MPGDTNGDLKVDVGDLGVLAANYGRSNAAWPDGDFNGDGTVDIGDLGILAANYGVGSIDSAAFKAEPAGNAAVCPGAGLALIGSVLLMVMMFSNGSFLKECVK